MYTGTGSPVVKFSAAPPSNIQLSASRWAKRLVERRRRRDREMRRRGEKGTRRLGEKGTRRRGEKGTRRRGEKGTRRRGEKGTGRQGDLVKGRFGQWGFGVFISHHHVNNYWLEMGYKNNIKRTEMQLDSWQSSANCELRTANCELRTANCELRTANCELIQHHRHDEHKYLLVLVFIVDR
jgi:hypothetical protein